MFRLNQSNTFLWPVTVSLPESGGKHSKETFDAEFVPAAPGSYQLRMLTWEGKVAYERTVRVRP